MTSGDSELITSSLDKDILTVNSPLTTALTLVGNYLFYWLIASTTSMHTG